MDRLRPNTSHGERSANHGNVHIAQNMKISRLIGFHINLVMDIWDFKTNDFKRFIGLITNRLF